jgi:chemotaxis protein histidine kinase CheA
MEWFLSILHVEPQLLKEFIESANTELNLIENVLKSDAPERDFNAILEKVYRSVHMVKGNASLLDLKFYAKKAHEFEEEIEEMRKKNELSASDFIPLVMHLSEMRADIDEINKMIERISQIHSHFRPKRSFESQMLVRSIENLIHTISKDLKKEVRLDHDNFNGETIPYQYRLLIKDLLVQLVRNSLKHGIELPTDRKKQGKSKFGLIAISTFTGNGNFGFTFRDDGRGLQIEKLKKIAIASGKWPVSEIKKWNDDKIADSIYEPGISTSESTDLVAGRGVGMDIVKQKIISHGGDITMAHKEGKFLEFTVILPVEDRRGSKKNKI